MSTRIETDIAQQRWLRCKNATWNKLEAFSCVMIQGAEFDDDGVIYHVTLPTLPSPDPEGRFRGWTFKDAIFQSDAGFATDNFWTSVDSLGFTYENDILPNEIGKVTFDSPAFCKVVDGSLATGGIYIPTSALGIISPYLDRLTTYGPGDAFLSAFRVFGPINLGDQSKFSDLAWAAVRCRVNRHVGEDPDGAIFL